MGSSTSAWGPETDGESLIDIRIEPPQQSQQGPCHISSGLLDDLGNLEGSPEEWCVVFLGDFENAARVFVRLVYKWRSS